MPQYPEHPEGSCPRWRNSQIPRLHWEEFPSGQGGPHTMGGSDHTADVIENIRTKCSDATLETTAGSAAAAAAAVTAHENAYSHANLPSNDEKQALGGTNGSPSGTNKYVTNSDPRNSDARTPTTHDNTKHSAPYATETALGNHESATTAIHGVGVSTVASVADVSTHAGTTTGVHGVGGSTVESASGAQGKVDAHKDATTGVHGAGASTLATTANITTHAGVTASVHGFDASGNAPAQSHDNTRHSTAYATATALSTHEGLTTTAHGGLIASSEKAAANGVASLNASSQLVQAVQDAAIGDAKLRNSGGCSVIGRAAGTSGAPADIAASADDQYLRRAAGVLGFGALPAPAAHDLGGASHNADTLANLNAKISDADVPALAGQLGGTAASPDVRGIRETSGPTLLTVAAIADTYYLKRSGTTIVGDVPTAALPELVMTKLASTADRTVTAGYGAYIPDWYEIGSGFATEIGAEAVMEIG